MAFVGRSERRVDLISSQTNDIGPGQYLAQDIIKARQSKKIPFESNTFRDITIKKEDMPGPGSYEYDDKYEKFNKMLAKQKDIKRQEPLYKSLENNFSNIVGPYSLLLSNEKKKAGFMSKEKRFKIDKVMTDVPGPGYYTTADMLANSINRSPKMEQVHKLINNSLTNGSQSPNRIVTIPNKHQAFGYEVDTKGHLVMNYDPDYNIRYSGLKSDTVGPGSYNVVKPSDWKKRSIDWSRKRNERSKTSDVVNTTMSNTFHDANSLDNLVDSSSIGNKSKKSADKLNMKKGKAKIFKQITDNRKKMLDLKMTNNDMLIDRVVYDETPGPGYYYREDNENLRRNFKPEKFQIFGSSSPRFNGKTSESYNNDVGPGLYFRDEMKLVKMNIEKIRENIGAQFIKKKDNEATEKFIEEKTEMISKLGPGAYNPDLPKKKNVTSVANFGSLQKRFVKEKVDRDPSPDPGSYHVKSKWIKDEENEKNKNPFRQYPLINKKENPIDILKDREKFEVPPIGSYNSDLMFSVGYKVAQKSNQYQSAVAPFSSMEKRFLEFKKSSEKIGPGLYYKENKIPNKQVFPPFKNGEIRRKEEIKESPIPGPGEYNNSSYFDWNKKSFNVLFI